MDEINLLGLRAHLGWSQDQMGAHLGVDRSTVSRMETGKQSISGPVARLLKMLAASPDPAGRPEKFGSAEASQ